MLILPAAITAEAASYPPATCSVSNRDKTTQDRHRCPKLTFVAGVTMPTRDVACLMSSANDLDDYQLHRRIRKRRLGHHN